MTPRDGEGLRVVFMGTPGVALPVLDGLLDGGYDVVGVYTRPDRGAGRGRRTTASPVKVAALERGLSVFQPASLRKDSAARAQMADLGPDVIVVAAYGLFLPADTLRLPALGCLNVHPSLLPRHRGPSPVASAILAGDQDTGVTLMTLDQGMDTGPIVAQSRPIGIGEQETTEELTGRLFRMGADLLLETLPGWAPGDIQSHPQDESRATVTRLLKRADGEIDWSRPVLDIWRQVRAMRPWPGTFTTWQGRTLKIIEARPWDAATPSADEPGLVVSGDGLAIGVVAGDGVLNVQRLQLEGRRPVGADELLRGYRDFPGSRLGQD
jgi:methionyl-tRNA formyltransferase